MEKLLGQGTTVVVSGSGYTMPSWTTSSKHVIFPENQSTVEIKLSKSGSPVLGQHLCWFMSTCCLSPLLSGASLG